MDLGQEVSYRVYGDRNYLESTDGVDFYWKGLRLGDETLSPSRTVCVVKGLTSVVLSTVGVLFKTLISQGVRFKSIVRCGVVRDL